MLRRHPAWQGQPWAPMLLSRLATVRRELGDIAGARAIVAEGLAVYPDHTDLVFKLALCAIDERDWAGAEVHARRCIELGDAPAAYSGTVGGGTYLAVAMLGQLSEAQGRLDEAEAHYREALARARLVLGARARARDARCSAAARRRRRSRPRCPATR